MPTPSTPRAQPAGEHDGRHIAETQTGEHHRTGLTFEGIDTPQSAVLEALHD